MVREIVREIQQAVPEYAQPLEGKFGEVLTSAVATAVAQGYEYAGKAHPASSDWFAMMRYVGKVEYLEGRSMDALQTAVRVGARVAWRHLSAGASALGVPTDRLLALAEAIFAYIDEISMVAIQGYTEAQGRAAGTRERRRRQLLKLLLSDPPASAQSITDLATAAGWPVPERVAVVAIEFRQDQHQLPTIALGQEVLVDLESGEPCLLLADPERQLERLAKQLSGRRAAVGPTVPLADAHRSLLLAQRALGFVQRGVLPGSPITRCADHLSILMMLSDEFLVAQLTNRALAPFAELKAKQRERLTSTLFAWLETRGGLNEIATKLDVHPQTVRYRMHQIEELLGDRMTDPEERLALEVALRAEKLLSSSK